jgi:hypothetical protein
VEKLDKIDNMDKPYSISESTILQLVSDISAIKTSQEKFEKELLGNGQPGRIQVLEEDVKSLNRKHWMISGGLVVAGHAIKGVIAKLFS